MPNKSNLRRLSLITTSAALIGLGVWQWTHRTTDTTSPARLARAALILRDGKLVPRDGGLPFTGIMFQKTTAGQVTSEVPVQEGMVHGLARAWHSTGQLEMEETYMNGISHGVRTRWFVEGGIRSTANIENGVLNGPYREFHKNGQLAVEMNMVQGKAEGLCQAWYEDGSLKSSVEMKAGQPVKSQYFTNHAGEVADK